MIRPTQPRPATGAWGGELGSSEDYINLGGSVSFDFRRTDFLTGDFA